MISFYDFLQRYTGSVEFAVLARAAASDEGFPRGDNLTSWQLRQHVRANGGTCQWKRAFMKAWSKYEGERRKEL